MKAVVVHQYGGPEVLKFEEYPDPEAGPGEVLVPVAATRVNPIDYKRRAGLMKDFYPIKFPGRSAASCHSARRPKLKPPWRRVVSGRSCW
jgi:NADPH:quinone reductase-like Zn-dependent oxidoreductase